MKIEKINVDDYKLLAKYHKELMEDEQHDNPVSIQEIETGMQKFLSTTDSGYLFLEDDQVIGYALIDYSKSPVCLRHFFICRDCRKRRNGTKAFNLLLRELNVKEVDIEVFSWNQRALLFWSSLGFDKRCVLMRYQNEE